MDDRPGSGRWPQVRGLAQWRVLSALVCGLAMSSHASEPAWPGEGWRVEHLQHAGLPQALRGDVLVQGREHHQAAHVLIRAPFNQVQPTVEQALAAVGRFDGSPSQSPRAYMREGWSRVLMSRHPDLRQAHARISLLEGLQRQVDAGALLSWELERNIQLAGASADSSPQALIQLPELQEDKRMWVATRSQEYGLMGRSRRVDEVAVTEMDFVLGAPATVVSIQTRLRWPNPKGRLIERVRDFNVLSSGPARFLQRRVVFPDVFTPVYEALYALPGGARLQVHASPKAWVLPIDPPRPVRQFRLLAPAAAAPGLETTSWSLQQDMGELFDLLPLADGSLLLATHERLHPMLWHYRPGAAARLLWRGETRSVNSARSRLLAGTHDGRVHLVLTDAVVAHDPASAITTHHPLQVPEGIDTPHYWHWRRGPDGGPELFDHVSSVTGSLHGGLRRLVAAQAPTADGEPWRFVPAFLSPRQPVAHGYRRGNTLLKPLDAFDAQGVWVEEPTGLALLDPDNGRVLRAIELPLRLGSADDHDDTGMATHVPDPFGSLRGRWIATGFQLGRESRRGMHVTSVDTGRTLLSAWLDGVSGLTAGSASADGTRIALGGGVTRAGSRVGIWHIGSGRQPAVADVALDQCRDLGKLAWSPDGTRLWGACQKAVLSWQVD